MNKKAEKLEERITTLINQTKVTPENEDLYDKNIKLIGKLSIKYYRLTGRRYTYPKTFSPSDTYSIG